MRKKIIKIILKLDKWFQRKRLKCNRYCGVTVKNIRLLQTIYNAIKIVLKARGLWNNKKKPPSSHPFYGVRGTAPTAKLLQIQKKKLNYAWAHALLPDPPWLTGSACIRATTRNKGRECGGGGGGGRITGKIAAATADITHLCSFNTAANSNNPNILDSGFNETTRPIIPDGFK